MDDAVSNEQPSDLRALQAEVADLRARLAQLDVMLYTLAADGTRTMLNDAQLAITGYDAGAFAAQPDLWQTLIHPEDRGLFRDLFVPPLAATAEITYRLRHRDGEWRSLRASLTGIYDEAGDFIAYRGCDRDVTGRRAVDAWPDSEALQRRDTILQAVAFAAERFLTTMISAESIQAALRQLGAAASASRVAIYTVGEQDAAGSADAQLAHEWHAPDVAPLTGDPARQVIRLREAGLTRWVERMNDRQSVYGLARDFPAAERPWLAQQGARAVVAVPVFVWQGWWGFIIFEDCASERGWSAAEHDALKAAAAMLGAAIEHRSIAQMLRDERDFVTAVLNTVGALVVVLDRDARIVHFNQACETLTGYTAAEVRGEPFYDYFVSPEERQHARTIFADILGGMYPYRYHNTWLTRQGEPRHITWSNTALLDAQGAVEYVIASGIDRTAQQQAEAAEHEQRILAEALVDTIAAITGTLDLEQVVDRILSNVEQVVPHDAVNIILIEGDRARPTYFRGYPQSVIDYFQHNTFPLDTPNLREMVETGQPFLVSDTSQYAGWMTMPATAWVKSYVAAPIRAGETVIGFLNLDSAMSGFFTPQHAERLQAFANQAALAIRNAQLYEQTQRQAETLRKRVAARTREAQQVKQRVETILNSSSDAILLLDADGTINQVNPAFDQMFGYGRDAVFGHPLREIATSADTAPLMAALHETVHRNQTGRLEMTACRQDSTTFDADVVLSPLQPVPGKEGVWGVICSVRDISIQKATEEQLRIALEQEKAVGIMRARLVSVASHEFRTPLTTIRSSVFLLEKRADRLAPAQRVEQFRKIRVSLENMTRLLDDVLILGRSEAGRMLFHPTRLDLEALCRDLIEQVLLSARAGFRIVFTASGPCHDLVLDEKLLRHILTNLLSNAVKYSPDHDSATLEIVCAELTIRLRVTDQGIGIPPEDLEGLFQSFQRAGNVGNIKGSGLGLAIARQATERHGGLIAVESELGVGTTFEVTLPVIPLERADPPDV